MGPRKSNIFRFINILLIWCIPFHPKDPKAFTSKNGTKTSDEDVDT